LANIIPSSISIRFAPDDFGRVCGAAQSAIAARSRYS
jgi:hypothetical protein